MQDEKIVFTPERSAPETSTAGAVESRPETVAEKAPEVSAEHGADERLRATLQKLGGVAPVAADDAADDARNAALLANADAQVGRLLELASVKGVAHAVKVAERLKQAYVLDQLHDDLMKKFHEGLKERRLT
jgi:hypothetical protein